MDNIEGCSLWGLWAYIVTKYIDIFVGKTIFINGKTNRLWHY